MGRRFWVFDWLEDHHIESVSQAADFLPKFGVIDDMRRRAEEASDKASEKTRTPFSIVAGAGVDLSGGGPVCPSPFCMRLQVDQLMRSVWHYFDRIVARDVFTPALISDSSPKQELIDTILENLPPLLYLREIGVEELMDFVPKSICREHTDRHAREAGLLDVLKRKPQILHELRTNSSFSYITESGVRYCEISNSLMPSSYQKPAKPYKHRERELHRALADEVFEEYLALVISDVMAAKKLKLPLGATHGLQGKLLESNRPPNVEEVLFHLELPVLNDVPADALLELRTTEADSFSQFRNKLREAAMERIKANNSADAKAIAEEIQLDVIRPALDKIRQRLAASGTALAKKSGVSLFLGTLATTCGILAGVPPAISFSALGIAVGAAGTAAHKHVEEKQQIALDDMFFLWQATEHLH